MSILDLVPQITQIYQKDNHTFTIEWSNGIIAHYRLSDLQKCCPCAGCREETTENRLKPPVVDPLVRAHRLHSVGRYGLAIQFTKGCSAGIYGFDMLYHMRKCEG